MSATSAARSCDSNCSARTFRAAARPSYVLSIDETIRDVQVVCETTWDTPCRQNCASGPILWRTSPLRWPRKAKNADFFPFTGRPRPFNGGGSGSWEAAGAFSSLDPRFFLLRSVSPPHELNLQSLLYPSASFLPRRIGAFFAPYATTGNVFERRYDQWRPSSPHFERYLAPSSSYAHPTMC